MTDFKKSNFCIDDGPVFKGYTNGNVWNGWERPCFRKDEAVKVLEHYYGKENIPDNAGNSWEFKDGKFLITDGDYVDDGPLEVLPFIIIIDGQKITVYGVGAGEWTWDSE